MPRVLGIHLNGSIPLGSAEECMRFASQALSGPNRLLRLPDGEPEERGHFTRWQKLKFVKQSETFASAWGPGSKKADDFIQEWEEAIRIYSEAPFETGYDAAAIESYQVFKELKKEGSIAKHVRFMVGLPTPLGVVGSAGQKLGKQLEAPYEKALLKSLDRIQKEIPAYELAIQWDMPLEFMFLEKAHSAAFGTDAWWEPIFEGIVERLARLSDFVKEGVEMGFHFCYGDSEIFAKRNAEHGHSSRHFVDPKDTGLMVKLANSLMQECSRHIDWISMPVPQDRVDRAYFEPLQQLTFSESKPEIVLGLVYVDDLEGSRKRIEAAGEFVPEFRVASPCGLGRLPAEKLRELFDIYAAICQAM